MTNRLKDSRFRPAALLLLGLMFGAGCNSAQQIRLRQPAAPPAQQDLTLRSNWTFSRSGGNRCQCVLSFPLPGSLDGPRDFHVYVGFPGTPGKHLVDANDAGAARGFLIQLVGERKGKATFVSGSVRLRKSWLTLGRTMLDLSVNCSDGSVVSGSVRLFEKPEEVRAFARRYAADVAAVEPLPIESQPAPLPRDPILSSPGE